MSTILFTISLFVIFSYFGYPLWLYLLTRWRPMPWLQDQLYPAVSIVIAAHNESINIRRRLENLLTQDYPSDLMEIVIVSDGSDDDTLLVIETVVEDWGRRGNCPQVRVINQQKRQGKPAALNKAMALASGEIVVYADARQEFERDAIRRLVENFADPLVGAVSGELLFREGNKAASLADGAGENKGSVTEAAGLYWRLEKSIRRNQALTGSVMGATGAIYAIRRLLFRPLPEDHLVDDLKTPINIMLVGQRVVFDDRAVAWDVAPTQGDVEWRRKVRTLTGVWQCLTDFFLFIRSGRWRLAGRFFAHKLSRLLVPWLLLLLLIGSYGANHPGWQIFALLQTLAYLLIFFSHNFPSLQRLPLLSTGYFFVLVNLAAAWSLINFMRGTDQGLWKTQRGSVHAGKKGEGK